MPLWEVTTTYLYAEHLFGQIEASFWQTKPTPLQSPITNDQTSSKAISQKTLSYPLLDQTFAESSRENIPSPPFKKPKHAVFSTPNDLLAPLREAASLIRVAGFASADQEQDLCERLEWPARRGGLLNVLSCKLQSAERAPHGINITTALSIETEGAATPPNASYCGRKALSALGQPSVCAPHIRKATAQVTDPHVQYPHKPRLRWRTLPFVKDRKRRLTEQVQSFPLRQSSVEEKMERGQRIPTRKVRFVSCDGKATAAGANCLTAAIKLIVMWVGAFGAQVQVWCACSRYTCCAVVWLIN